MSNPASAILSLANLVLTVLTYAIIAQAVLSWFQPDLRNPFVRLLHKLTDPIMGPLDRLIPSFGGLNVTPLIAIVILQFIQNLLPRLLL